MHGLDFIDVKKMNIDRAETLWINKKHSINQKAKQNQTIEKSPKFLKLCFPKGSGTTG